MPYTDLPDATGFIQSNLTGFTGMKRMITFSIVTLLGTFSFAAPAFALWV